MLLILITLCLFIYTSLSVCRSRRFLQGLIFVCVDIIYYKQDEAHAGGILRVHRDGPQMRGTNDTVDYQ